MNVWGGKARECVIVSNGGDRESRGRSQCHNRSSRWGSDADQVGENDNNSEGRSKSVSRMFRLLADDAQMFLGGFDRLVQLTDEEMRLGRDGLEGEGQASHLFRSRCASVKEMPLVVVDRVIRICQGLLS